MTHEIRGLAFGPSGQPYVMCSCGELVSMGTAVHRPYWIAHRDGISVEAAIEVIQREKVGA